MSTTADIYTHLAFWDVFTDDLVDGLGLVIYFLFLGLGLGVDPVAQVQSKAAANSQLWLANRSHWPFEFGHKLSIAQSGNRICLGCGL